MKKTIILGMALIIVLAGIVLISGSSQKAEKTEFPYTHSHTKAICTDENFCQDYEIVCQGQNPISISPVTGAAIQFDKDWQDPRPKEMIESFC